jgi:D-3-phosphoglycerate dehydrogenase / 2-oxoglutarate reductase
MTFKVIARIGSAEGIEGDLAGLDAELIRVRLGSEEDLINCARDADAVIAGAVESYTRRVIESLAKCKVISRVGIGCDNIDLEAATEQGIPVAYVPDASIAEVSDHALALLMAFSRKLLRIDQAVKRGAWEAGKRDLIQIRTPMFRLSNQTLGLVGMGRIGGALARKAQALGMQVLVYDPYLQAQTARELRVELVEFDRLLRESDFISLHAPLTKGTRHLFGLEQFRKMKPTAYLINTARGGLIDEEALFTALSRGNIAGAGLDVTDPEPPRRDNPLLKLENVIMTAHTAYYSEDSNVELRQRTAEAVIWALQGKWPRTLANPLVRDGSNRRIK